jgi:glucokinase
MQEKNVLALDLGGTKLLVGLLDRQANILWKKEYPSGFLTQAEEMKLLFRSVDDFLSQTNGAAPLAIGAGLIGQIDSRNGIWQMIDPGRRDPTPVVQLLLQRYGLPCRVDNDVKAAAQAEQVHGAGQKMDDFIYLNIGTGIGAGIFTDGHLVRGWQNDAGEVGHLSVSYDGNTLCPCGRFGCVEAIASGAGMDRRLRGFAARYPLSPLVPLAEHGFVRAETIFRFAQENDPLAACLTTDAADAISELILNLVRVFNPRRVVLGGGISGDPWFQKMLEGRLRVPLIDSLDAGIVPSALDPSTVGLVGASVIGFLAADAEKERK